MSGHHSLEQAAIARQLADALAGYERALDGLLLQHWDPELYRSLSDAFDRMQELAGALPQLTYAWTELLISRVELTHALWTQPTPARIDGRVVAVHERHRKLIEQLRDGCLAYAELPAARP